MKFDYKLSNAGFLRFFVGYSGYRLNPCHCMECDPTRETIRKGLAAEGRYVPTPCSWRRVADELANPAHDIDPASFCYEMTGKPVPVAEGLILKKTWERTRKKIQIAWNVYVGRTSLQKAYQDNLEIE
jgi:hypothetical protein